MNMGRVELLAASVSLLMDEKYEKIAQGTGEPIGSKEFGAEVGQMFQTLKDIPFFETLEIGKVTEEEMLMIMKLAALTSAKKQGMEIADFMAFVIEK